MYQSIEEVGTDYISATQDETDAMFRQGEIVLDAVDQGFKVKQVVRHCASLTRRKARTVFQRYAVARTFPPETRNAELDWSIHLLCASTDAPHKWLEIASEGYQDENGEIKGHTYRSLKAAIKAAGGDPDKGKPIVWLDAVDCVVASMVGNLDGTSRIAFNLPTAVDLPTGVVLQITLVQAPAPELEIAA